MILSGLFTWLVNTAGKSEQFDTVTIETCIHDNTVGGQVVPHPINDIASGLEFEASQSVRILLGLALCIFGSLLAVKRKKYIVLALCACFLSFFCYCVYIYTT